MMQLYMLLPTILLLVLELLSIMYASELVRFVVTCELLGEMSMVIFHRTI